MMNAITRALFLVLLLAAGFGERTLVQETKITPAWPHPVPCRIRDGANPDLLVMTLGQIDTPPADGVFDPVKDLVRLKDGTALTNYYRDVLRVQFYQPLDKPIGLSQKFSGPANDPRIHFHRHHW